jgi:glycosyltransferase involved in cell wall biosynthesis
MFHGPAVTVAPQLSTLRGVPSPTLAVIGAGFGRTGTLSLREALQRLGFSPCEHAINSSIHPERHALWLEAVRCKRLGEPIDWRPLFAGYRATVDWPGAYFWRELVAVHPEAKVVLTMRDPARWYDSLQRTSYARFEARTQTFAGRILFGVLAWLDPRTSQKYRTFQETVWEGTFDGRFSDRHYAIEVFDQHNREVQSEVAPERLLVFDVKEGWEPLCQFLGVAVPVGEPFPHTNSAAGFGRFQRRHVVTIARALLQRLGAVAGVTALAADVRSRGLGRATSRQFRSLRPLGIEKDSSPVERPMPTRVLHVITRMILGGAQENTLLSVEGLNRIPTYDVSIVSGVDHGPEGDLLARTRQGADLVIVPELGRNVNPIADVVALWKLYLLIKKGRYHIVHTHLAKAGVLGRVAAWLARTPIIVHGLHGLVFHEYQPWFVNRTWWAVQKLMGPITDHYISVSSAISQKAIEAGIASSDNLTTIYSGMELDWFLNATVDPASARRQLGIPDDAPVVGKIARMVDIKNHDALLDAAPAIIARHPDVRFLLVGDGPLLEHLRSRANRMGISKHVVFTGLVARERIPEMLAAMDVLAHTALYEGLPRVLAQALAMGKPCVAFDADGAKEVVVPEETGYLVRPGDTAGLAATVNRLLEDPVLRARMGDAGRRRVDPAFRTETMVQQIDTVYQELTRRHAERLARVTEQPAKA